MTPITTFLHFCAQNGRWVMVAGLLVGIFIQPLADAVRPWVGHVVAVLLFLAALRIKPSEVLGNLGGLRKILTFVSLFQILIPCIIAAIFLWSGTSSYLAIALLLTASSAPISASPSVTLITGNDPAPALRLLIISTALLPLTIVVPFFVWPVLGDLTQLALIAFKLFLVIFLASSLAFAIRKLIVRELSTSSISSIDGLTALCMAGIVIGLMTGITDAAINRPWEILITLTVAFAANIGMQLIVWNALAFFNTGPVRVAFSISAGNRNLAIFLAALPVAVTDPILLFIACYQIPMYLTPTLLKRIYAPKNQ